VFKTIK